MFVFMKWTRKWMGWKCLLTMVALLVAAPEYSYSGDAQQVSNKSGQQSTTVKSAGKKKPVKRNKKKVARTKSRKSWRPAREQQSSESEQIVGRRGSTSCGLIVRHMMAQLMVAGLQNHEYGCEGSDTNYQQFMTKYEPSRVSNGRELSKQRNINEVVTRLVNNYSRAFYSNPQRFCAMSNAFFARAMAPQRNANNLCDLSQDPGLMLTKGIINYNGTIDEEQNQRFATATPFVSPGNGSFSGYRDDYYGNETGPVDSYAVRGANPAYYATGGSADPAYYENGGGGYYSSSSGRWIEDPLAAEPVR